MAAAEANVKYGIILRVSATFVGLDCSLSLPFAAEAHRSSCTIFSSPSQLSLLPLHHQKARPAVNCTLNDPFQRRDKTETIIQLRGSTNHGTSNFKPEQHPGPLAGCCHLSRLCRSLYQSLCAGYTTTTSSRNRVAPPIARLGHSCKAHPVATGNGDRHDIRVGGFGFAAGFTIHEGRQRVLVLPSLRSSLPSRNGHPTVSGRQYCAGESPKISSTQEDTMGNAKGTRRKGPAQAAIYISSPFLETRSRA